MSRMETGSPNRFQRRAGRGPSWWINMSHDHQAKSRSRYQQDQVQPPKTARKTVEPTTKPSETTTRPVDSRMARPRTPMLYSATTYCRPIFHHFFKGVTSF